MKKKVILKELIGTKKNYLTLLSLADPKFTWDKSRNRQIKVTMWNCKCDCGKEKIISHSNIMTGATKSCGCKRKFIINECIQKWYIDKTKFPVEKLLYSRYKSDAKRDDREFLISKELFIEIVNSNCYYCGRVPHLERGNKYASITKLLNGVDRVDSSKGYVENNVVPCCSECNRAKMARNIDDYKEWIRISYKHLFETKIEDNE